MTKGSRSAGTLRAARAARAAALDMAVASNAARNRALRDLAAALKSASRDILRANARDMAESGKEAAAGRLKAPLLARLELSETKISQMADGVSRVAKLPDPLGKIELARELDENLRLYRVSVPIGVIACIFESRPDALAQIASLSVKSGNAVLLKGGKEAAHTNRALAGIVRSVLKRGGALPPDAVQLLETREEVRALLDLDDWVDLLIPRGGNDLVRFVKNHTRIPVLGHADGLCAVYVDKDADLAMATDIVVDAKTQYPSVCNAMETLLVHEKIAARFLPILKKAFDGKEVEIRGCAETRKILKGVKAARAADFDTEFLDLVAAVRVVPDIEEAIRHINEHGSGHTDAIVTRNAASARRFLERVDSSCVMHNASGRFADGFRFGMGAEVGISTNKFHARGPVGLDGLVVYNYRVLGAGQTVARYSGARPRRFTHKLLAAPENWSGLKI